MSLGVYGCKALQKWVFGRVRFLFESLFANYFEFSLLITVIRPFFLSPVDLFNSFPCLLASTVTVTLQGAQTFLQSAPPCARLLGFPDLVPSVTVVLLSKVCCLTEGISEVT